ncbi:MAG TPA: TadG family pilus assembly protein [Parachlamydiaceae bacterium]|nr:TadG family pilus assembly protein [Parachlamydiaceae bacterium]
MNKHKLKLSSNRNVFIKGQVIVFVGLMLLILIMFGALSIEIAHIFIVRNELQNAADSSALKGAAYLYPSTNEPSWSLAQSEALSFIPNNKVENVALINATVTTGYWNLSTATLKPTSVTPGTNEVPAVQVTISKSPGNNGGAKQLIFGTLFGLESVNLSAKAVAVVGSPNGVNASDLFPIAMGKGLYDEYWDMANKKPKIDPATGNPYIFRINSGPEGGWSSFLQVLNDANSIRNLIINGNPTALSIGDSIYFAPGVKTSNYSDVPSNVDVFVAITENTTAGAFHPIVAFGALHIDFGVGGNLKYIQVRFTNNLKLPDVDIGGPNYGIYTAPRLAQ